MTPCWDATAALGFDRTLEEFRDNLAAETRRLSSDPQFRPHKLDPSLKKWKARYGRDLAKQAVASGTAVRGMVVRELAAVRAFFEVAGEKEVADGLREAWWKAGFLSVPVRSERELSLTWMPAGSWRLKLTFELVTDLICADDTAMHVINNPVKKDRVHGHPEYWGPSWKGVLRTAFRTLHGDDTSARACEERLFGSVWGKGSDGRAGRLRFFTTRFSHTGFAMIHAIPRSPKPDPRDTKKPKGPILYETVPPGAKGVFQLLYCPLDENCGENELVEDRQAAAESVRWMFHLGIGAKSSSGFGEVQVIQVEMDPPELESRMREDILTGAL